MSVCCPRCFGAGSVFTRWGSIGICVVCHGRGWVFEKITPVATPTGRDTPEGK